MTQTILGFPFLPFVLGITALLNFIAAGLVWPSFKKEREKLIDGFFVWCLGMGLWNVFFSLGHLTDNMVWTHFGSFAGLTASAYLARIAFLTFMPKLENLLFYSLLAIAWLMTGWMFLVPHQAMFMERLIVSYIILMGGILGGFTLIYLAAKATAKIAKIKAFFGGLGVVFSSLIAYILWFAGVFLPLSALLMVLGGLMIGLGLVIARKLERENV